MGWGVRNYLFCSFYSSQGVAFVVVWLVLRGGSQSAGEVRDARQILDERHAGGELDRDEYERMRRDIEAD